MSRPRAHELFSLGGQWIAREPGRRQLYRYWTDAEGTGRTRRASLGTSDLELAKRRLAEVVVKGAPRTGDSLLSVVLEDYFISHTDKLPSRSQSRNAGKILVRHFGPAAKISDLTLAKQKGFVDELVGLRGRRVSYASRNLSVLRAAIAHAGIAHRIVYSEAGIQKEWRIMGAPARRTFVPSDEQLASLLSADIPDDLFRWCVLEMATAARAEAALELAPAQRVRAAGVVDLNPAGRAQNKKYRPIVREPKVLTGWLDKWEAQGLATRGGRYCGYVTIEGVKSALDRAATDLSLPFSTRSFRHKVTTVLRQARVSEDEIATQLGHHRLNLRTTSLYGEWSPDYLSRAAEAIDAWFAQLQKLCARPLFSHGKPANVRTRKKNAA